MTILLFLVAILALIGAAFCAGAETGFLSVRRERVLYVAREGSVRAKMILEAISNLGRTTTALLVGNNLATVCYSSASSALIAALYADSAIAQFWLSFVSALAVLFLGEFLPKLLCAARPLRRLLWLAPVWTVFARFFAPIGALVQRLVEKMMPRREVKAKITPETVLKILSDRKDGVKISNFESALISRLMTLRARGEFVVPDTLLSALE